MSRTHLNTNLTLESGNLNLSFLKSKPMYEIDLLDLTHPLSLNHYQSSNTGIFRQQVTTSKESEGNENSGINQFSQTLINLCGVKKLNIINSNIKPPNNSLARLKKKIQKFKTKELGFRPSTNQTIYVSLRKTLQTMLFNGTSKCKQLHPREKQTKS